METYLYKHFYAILVMMRKVDKKVFICVFYTELHFTRINLFPQLLLENSQKRIKITKKWFITKKGKVRA